jgi:hypothetical protein
LPPCPQSIRNPRRGPGRVVKSISIRGAPSIRSLLPLSPPFLCRVDPVTFVIRLLTACTIVWPCPLLSNRLFPSCKSVSAWNRDPFPLVAPVVFCPSSRHCHPARMTTHTPMADHVQPVVLVGNCGLEAVLLWRSVSRNFILPSWTSVRAAAPAVRITSSPARVASDPSLFS